MKKKEPRDRGRGIGFLPVQPRPPRPARSRSRTALQSTPAPLARPGPPPGQINAAGRTGGDPVEAELTRGGLHRLAESEADQGHVLRAFTTRWARVSVRPPSSRNFT